MNIYIDGQFFPEEQAKISVFDHGLLYGDGVFEGIRFYNGRVFRMAEHLDRLWDSARAIRLEVPLSRHEMEFALLETIRRNGFRDGYVRLIITRGIGNLGLSPDRCKRASVIIIAAQIALYDEALYQRGLEVVTCATRRISPAALSPSIKSLNYLNNILAKIEATQAGAGEGLMLNEQGYVAECTGDNIFILKHGELFTPAIHAGALRGITRAVVFEIAAEFGMKVNEPNLTRYDIYTADECFLTGTAAEIIPAVCLDERPIGDGTPGPVTLRFIERFRDLTQTTGAPVYVE
jgi:branched-chain amino acid aminotransferase